MNIVSLLKRFPRATGRSGDTVKPDRPSRQGAGSTEKREATFALAEASFDAPLVPEAAARPIPPGAVRLSPATRDVRIDFFRGLALYMIYLDHVQGDALARFTYGAFGFSNSAEIFVLLSGLACGIAYSRVLARGGYLGLFKALARRAARIYVFYAATSIAAIAILAAALTWSVPHDVRSDFQSILVTSGEPFRAMWMALCLMSPPITDVLVLYILLTLFVTPLFLIAARRWPSATLATSFVVWVVAQFFPNVSPPSQVYDLWFFNVFAWQFLFSTGLYFGMTYNSVQSPWQSVSRVKWLIPVAWLVVVVSFLLRFVLPIFERRIGLEISSLHVPATAEVSMTRNLSAIRLAHILCVALLVATYLRAKSPLLQSAVLKPVIKSGAHSLEVFSLSIVLAYSANALIWTVEPSRPSQLILDMAVFLLMALTAFAVARRRSQRRSLPERRFAGI